MNYSNCWMAWTVFAQTLKTSCCCVCSVWRSEPFCNFRSRSPESFPLTSPLPLYFCISCLPHLLLLWPSLISPITVVAEQCCVTMLMMSPLCPVSCSFQKKKKKKTVCCLSWLAVFLCEVTIKKSMLKRDKTKQRHYGKKAMLAMLSRALGPSLIGGQYFGPFYHSF